MVRNRMPGGVGGRRRATPPPTRSQSPTSSQLSMRQVRIARVSFPGSKVGSLPIASTQNLATGTNSVASNVVGDPGPFDAVSL